MRSSAAQLHPDTHLYKHTCTAPVTVPTGYPSSRMHVTALCLVTLIFIHQVFCSPVVKDGGQSDALQDPVALRRVARMSPMWRTIGTKPHKAYCQNNIECSSRLCRNGHCSYSHAVHSKK